MTTYTPTEKLVKCREIWRKTMAYKAEGEGLVLELMRHLDTTPEQLADCRRVTLSIDEMLTQDVTGLRKAYPRHENNYFLQYPWWDEKYNRYDQPKENL